MRLVLFRPYQQLRTLVLCFCFAFTLLACSPKLDWRTVKNESLGYAALFPRKPQLIDRSLSYQDNKLKQSLEFVKADDDIFAVMTTEIPVALANQVSAIEQLLKSVLLQQTLSPNQTTPSEFNQVKESSSKIGAIGHQKQASQDYFLDLPQAKRVMRIRWLIRPMADGGLYLYQVSVVRAQTPSNPMPSLEQENINIFFDEFRPN
ncbi:hypothetical protein [Polynucleobacter sp. UK-FUSCHL-C3]|uniref:Lipoprotein n=1 Tax=Polynucleobacter sp. UK-FUSCHL-C3 TaxID=2955208 RepID=A0AAU8A2I6_9BURK